MSVKIPGNSHWLLRIFFMERWKDIRYSSCLPGFCKGIYGDTGTFIGSGIGDPGSGE